MKRRLKKGEIAFAPSIGFFVCYDDEFREPCGDEVRCYVVPLEPSVWAPSTWRGTNDFPSHTFEIFSGDRLHNEDV